MLCFFIWYFSAANNYFYLTIDIFDKIYEVNK